MRDEGVVRCELLGNGPSVDTRTVLGPLIWLGDELPLSDDYAELVRFAEDGVTVSGRIRCEIEILPGGTVTVFRSPACTEDTTVDIVGQVYTRSRRVRDVTPGARGRLWATR